MHDEWYMEEALKEAKKAFAIEEAPIGAVIEYEGKIIGRGYNQRNSMKNPLAHGEIIAINEAASFMKDWRLEDCTMYVTLEPCPMCAGAIVQSRIKKIVIGAPNYKAGSAGTVINLLNQQKFNHQVEIVNGILFEACSQILKEFFKNLRKKKNNQKLETANNKEQVDI